MGKDDLAYSQNAHLPSRPIQQLQRPFQAFMHVESASGVVLLICTAIALVAANSSFAEAYDGFWHQKLRLAVGQFELSHSLGHWVNDGLMAVFFFVIGLEIKRELVIGELSDPRKVVLPVAAALGGVLAPVMIYLAFQRGQPGQDGWAVPMATDIAFVVGCLSLLSKRIPSGLSILMLSLAIVDDLMAVVVIAIFYTSSISASWLLAAGVGLLAILVMNRLGIRSVWIYFIAGAWVSAAPAGAVFVSLSPSAMGLSLFGDSRRRAHDGPWLFSRRGALSRAAVIRNSAFPCAGKRLELRCLFLMV